MNSRHTMTAGPNLKSPIQRPHFAIVAPFCSRKNSRAEKELALEDTASRRVCETREADGYHALDMK